MPISEFYREDVLTSSTFYKSRAKYFGMDAPLMVRINELEDENRPLKKHAEERLKSAIIKNMAKEFKAILAKGGSRIK